MHATNSVSGTRETPQWARVRERVRRPRARALPNVRIAGVLEEVARLLEQQGASRPRVETYRAAATAVRAQRSPMSEVLRAGGTQGLAGLAGPAGVGPTVAHAIRELMETGRLALLGRLRGEDAPLPDAATAPRVGIETIEQLEVAPSVTELLAVDREYRAGAMRGTLPTLTTPRAEARGGTLWLPVLHAERRGWHCMAIYSNTPLARQLGRVFDWVELYYDGADGEAHFTVLTACVGDLSGRRVVRDREAECRELYAAPDAPPAEQMFGCGEEVAG
jgi:DNA polymerase (family X)